MGVTLRDACTQCREGQGGRLDSWKFSQCQKIVVVNA